MSSNTNFAASARPETPSTRQADVEAYEKLFGTPLPETVERKPSEFTIAFWNDLHRGSPTLNASIAAHPEVPMTLQGSRYPMPHRVPSATSMIGLGVEAPPRLPAVYAPPRNGLAAATPLTAGEASRKPALAHDRTFAVSAREHMRERLVILGSLLVIEIQLVVLFFLAKG